MTPSPAAGRSERLRLAVFVSPHGFGHAARSAAVLAELDERLRAAGRAFEPTLFTTVPRWFFEESLAFPFAHRELACDVGLVQKSAVEEDLSATFDRLEAFRSETKDFHRRELQEELRISGFDAVLCDIAPLGLAAARDAGLPAILVENFTWDWIYEPLVAAEPRFAPWIERMRELFALADLRIQAEPVCAPLAEPVATALRGTPPSMESFSPLASTENVLPSNRLRARVAQVPPIARRPRSSPAAVRERLGIAAGRPLVLVSMGGVRWRFAGFDRWRAATAYDFVVPGGVPDGATEERRGNLVLLPHHTPVFHPDLVAAADVVVGKLGYSTLAEAHAAGARLLFPPRAGFREHAVLADFARRALPAEEISLAELDSGAWIARLPALLARARPAAAPSGGAAAAATAILDALAGAS